MPGERNLAQLLPGKGYRVMPTVLHVVAGADPGVFRVAPDRAVQMDVHLVERGGGRAVVGGSVRGLYHTQFFSLLEDDPGRFSGPVTEGQLLIVDAPGHSRTVLCPTAADLRRASITVQLVPTEGSLVPVMILDGTSATPVGGVTVLVGGRERGKTDPTNGIVELEPTCKVADIEIRLDPKRYELAVRPEVRGETLADAPDGALFIVLPVISPASEEDQ